MIVFHFLQQTLFVLFSCCNSTPTYTGIKFMFFLQLSWDTAENTNSRGSITALLASCLFCVDSAALLVLNEQQFSRSTLAEGDKKATDTDVHLLLLKNSMCNTIKSIPRYPLVDLFFPWIGYDATSVTSKKTLNVRKSCPKIISLEKWTILKHLQKLPKNVGNLGKIIVVTDLKSCLNFNKSPNMVTLDETD